MIWWLCGSLLSHGVGPSHHWCRVGEGSYKGGGGGRGRQTHIMVVDYSTRYDNSNFDCEPHYQDKPRIDNCAHAHLTDVIRNAY